MSNMATRVDANMASRRESVPALPLAMAGMGRSLRIVRINAGNGLCEKLSAMGFVPGTTIEVLSDGSRGPMIVVVKGSRVVLSRGMALKVLVE